MLEVDAAAAVPWTKPADWKFDLNDPRRDFGTAFPGGTNVGFCDGSTTFLGDSYPDADLRALFTRSGGEIQAPF